MNRRNIDSKYPPSDEVAPERPITGCCSSLSAPDGDNNGWEDFQSACFEDNKDYEHTQPTPHSTVSREELLKRMNEYHGLCLADDNIDSFVESQNTVTSAIEQLMNYSAEHNGRASLL